MFTIMSAIMFAMTSTASASTVCHQVEVCDYTGYFHEECRINRRGQRVCDIIAEETCSIELECYEDAPNPQDCYYLIDFDAIYECLQG